MQPGYLEFGNYRDYPVATQVLEKVFFVGVSPTITLEMLDYMRATVEVFVEENF